MRKKKADKIRKKVILFWGGEGYGHLVAARAIEKQLQILDPTIEVILKDTLDFPTKLTKKLITGSYYILTQYMPKVFDRVYERAMEGTAKVKSIADAGMAKQLRPEKMLAYLEQEKPDCVLVTFSPAAEMIIYLRDRGKLLDIPVGHVLVDYVSNHYFSRLGERLEMTFVPHPSFLDDFARWGHPKETMCASGVPIFTEHLKAFSKQERKRFLESQNLEERKKILVLVSGAAGVGNFPRILQSIAREVKTEAQIVVICGRNKKNYSEVQRLAKKFPKHLSISLHALLPTELALQFVKAADLVITKSGSLTPTELNYAGKAAVYLDINGGQERHNSNFIAKHGLGKLTKDQDAVGALVKELLESPKEIQAIQNAQAEFCRSIEPSLITDWIFRVLENSKTN